MIFSNGLAWIKDSGKVLLFCWSIGGLSFLLPAQSVPEIQLITQEEHPYFGALCVSGIEPQVLNELSTASLGSTAWKQLLAVHLYRAIDVEGGELPPMLGQYSIQQDTLWFFPRLPFIEGKKYTIHLEWSKLYEKSGLGFPDGKWPSELITSFSIPIRQVQAVPKVESIYPSMDTIPANLLKVYILFSVPMRPGDAHRHLRLEDENGTEIKGAFLQMEQELWDAQNRRLTIWFDPGRIKRDLEPNRLKGTPLKAQNTYRLKLLDGWRAANSVPLSDAYSKTYHVQLEDRRRPDPQEWILIPPAVGTKEALFLEFPEPMDYGTLLGLVNVLDQTGAPVPGTIRVVGEEQVWQFIPQLPWQNATYKIRIGAELEDLAGNNLERLFDTPLDQVVPLAFKSPFLDLLFQPTSAK